MEVSVRVKRLRRIAGRYYWRPSSAITRIGFRMVPLGSDLMTAIAHADRLNREVAERQAGIDRELHGDRVGTIAALLTSYEREDHFAQLAANTRKQYLGIMREIRANAGDLPVNGITRKDMKALYRSLLPRGTATAAAHMRFWRILLGYAVDEGLRADNPATRLKVKASRPRTQVWKPDEVAAFCRAAEAAGQPSVALAVLLAYETAQRISDVLRASWRDLDGTTLQVVQQKTRARVAVPLSPELLWHLERAGRRGMTIIAREDGSRWADVTFRAAFVRIRARAGLQHLRFHDLRRTALSEAGAGGATVIELKALGGHADMSSLQRYVVPDEVAARGAQDKRGTNHRKVAKEWKSS
jgi:integrase